MKDKPRLQVAFTYDELVAIRQIAQKEARTVRGQIRHMVLEELYARGVLQRPRGLREED